MANNGADSVLMPVIYREIGSAVRFQQGKVSEINPRGKILSGGGGLRRISRFGIAAERGQAKTRRDHPQKEMRPEVTSAKLSPARQNSAQLPHQK